MSASISAAASQAGLFEAPPPFRLVLLERCATACAPLSSGGLQPFVRTARRSVSCLFSDCTLDFGRADDSRRFTATARSASMAARTRSSSRVAEAWIGHDGGAFGLDRRVEARLGVARVRAAVRQPAPLFFEARLLCAQHAAQLFVVRACARSISAA